MDSDRKKRRPDQFDKAGNNTQDQPARYSQVVWSQRSRAAPINHPATVAAGKTNASWLYFANWIQLFFFSEFSGLADMDGKRKSYKLPFPASRFLPYQTGDRRDLGDTQRPVHDPDKLLREDSDIDGSERCNSEGDAHAGADRRGVLSRASRMNIWLAMRM